MYKLLFLLFCSIFNSQLFSYEGEENVNEVFSDIVDINHPTLDEYKKIEQFLLTGNRPYLAPILVPPPTGGYESERRSCRRLKLVGKNNEMPIHEIYHYNVSPDDKERCIIIYGSYNYPYPGKVQVLLSELKKCGFRGHVIWRIGGYPNLAEGGLRLCHIPYSWKLASLLEARHLGYRYILWLDLAMHPLWDLEGIFETIAKNGYLCTEAGFPLDYPYGLGQHLPNAIRALNVSLDQLPLIRHLSSQIIGLDTANHHVNQFLDEWLKETLKVETCINWYPEELCYSVVAWRNNIRPTCHFGEVVFTRANYSKEIRWNRQFYWDENRENKTQWDPRILEE